MNELCCKPTSRCFKGYTILFMIWAVACVLLGVMIPPIVKAHGGTKETGHTDGDTAAEIKERLHKLILGTSILAITFGSLAVLSLFTCLGLKKRESNRDGLQTVLTNEMDI
jgi:hypothetical protein